MSEKKEEDEWNVNEKKHYAASAIVSTIKQNDSQLASSKYLSYKDEYILIPQWTLFENFISLGA